MEEQRGIWNRMGSLLRWLLLMVLVCAAFLVICRHLVAIGLDKEIRSHVVAILSERYPGMEIRVQAARRVEGRGIEIRGLTISSISEETEHRELVRIDEIFASCSTDLRDLINGRPEIRQLTVRRLKVRATRYPDGQWNISHLLPLPQFGGVLPTVTLQDSAVELRDLGKQGGGVLALRDIDIQLKPEARPGDPPNVRLSGRMLGDHFKDVKVQGEINPADGSWLAWGTIDGLEMSPRLLAALPTDIADHASLLATLRARAHFEFRLGHQPGAAVPFSYELKGQLAEGRIDDQRLPYPLTDLVADIHCDNQLLTISNVTARSGPSQLHLSCRCEDFLTDAIALQLTATINQLPLDHQLFQALPDELKVEWEKFDPAGMVDVMINVHTENGGFVPDVSVTCRGVSFAYWKFPYRLEHAAGMIRYDGNRISIRDFTVRAGSQTIHLASEFIKPGPMSTGWLTLRAAGPIPIDEDLIAALKPAGQRIVRSLGASGMITLVSGRIERTRPGEPPTSRFELDVQNGSVEFERFPYPIQKVNGRLVLADRTWHFREFNGFHGSSHIHCNGGWVPDSNQAYGGKLTLDFQCSDVLLDDDLRNAMGSLDPGLQDFWASLRPRGTVDHVAVSVKHDSHSRKTDFDVNAEKWGPERNIEGRSISLFPRWLPLRLNNVTGGVHFSGGKLQLTKIRGFHGDTEIELAGHGRIAPDKRWAIELTRLNSDRFRIDHSVIEALPKMLQPALRQLDYRGPLSINGAMSLSGGPNMELTSGWDLLFDIENGAILSKLDLKHIYGAVRLTGMKNESGFSSRGELEIDSVMCHGIQVTQLQGPIWLDRDRILLGAKAERGLADRIPRQLTAQVMGGTVAMDMQVMWSPLLPFAAEVSLANGDVRQIAQGLHAGRHNSSGRAFATLHINGNSSGLHTLKGSGDVRLRQADIYELPVMVALLSFLSLRPADTTAFTRSDIDFHVDGTQLYFDRIDFSGDAISLKGEGWMDLNRRIDLSFYALVGRHEFQLPIVSAILAEASRNILRIQVAGTVDHPSVTRKALPELDETLQRIFPEATIQSNGSRPFWSFQQNTTQNETNPRR